MLYCKYNALEKLALKGKAIHGGYIYVGPASLCPCPDLNTPFLIITGDDNKYAKILIHERAARLSPDLLVRGLSADFLIQEK